ncbi:hypothetical protein QFZ77_002978 [Paenibacillus sp. V4I3]|uniref:hypothetical protein n=1 Tax=Paenibacillus sp. V4I3 TaxID=3042305 RepID=UPI0027844DE1|nr:hypothetical protein [Paenibacillus sp. V4I3]MDQ0874319.1 hypothetical protein [Paenibacillus sp. V4I3]
MQRTYKLMRQLLVVVALLVVSTGCSNTESTIEKTTKNEVLNLPKSQQLQELPFESGIGRAIIIFEESGADCIIYAKGLNPGEKYTISLVVDNGVSPGVIFGPIENVKMKVGSLEDEVMFKPNSEGELFVSMRNPIRLFTVAKEELFFKIESENKKVIMKTVPFLVNK